ncbi:type I-F CRISPR-associated protein Csy2 [uncultured Desulfuromonas sp.]|uniref:type I-F CRISPR-associated protein Csy2 n=1 Tax=uncultured Desulfuromonas sp. TaxID=181013 RepID=UPI002AAAEF16|nr:type I-F CRISPR-associated protein Csy2 [uncultured Desulfuromonas sp.]
MKALLVLKHLQVQNANAISGLTWGFPAITHFLGFSHALSRFVQEQHRVTLGGCAVICHQHEVQACQPSGYGEYVFALTRNPLTKEGKTAPFNEEGRVHLDISLVIECDFSINAIDFDTDDDQQDQRLFEQQLSDKILTMRLAGGTILDMGRVQYVPLSDIPEQREKVFRRLMLSLLPGFLLVERRELLQEHFDVLCQQQPGAELLDAWLDFSALKYSAQTQSEEKVTPDSDTPAEWVRVDKPGQGWLVPIMTGYKAISPLYEAGEVTHTRDSQTPFRFAESTYSIGQWLSPHRVKDIRHIFWHYLHKEDWYLCQNTYQIPVEIN